MQTLILAAVLVAVFLIAVCQSIAPINVSMFGLTSWGLIWWAVCAVALGLLTLLVVLISSKRPKVSYKCFHGFQIGATIFAAFYAVWCAARLILNVVVIPANFDQTFIVNELIPYIIVWVLAPPIYFFAEYQAVENNCIEGFSNSKENLKTVKDYADNASKVWAGVLALLAALIALKTGKP
jgi:hypothetical protein